AVVGPQELAHARAGTAHAGASGLAARGGSAFAFTRRGRYCRARTGQRLTRARCGRHETRTHMARVPGQKALPIKDKAPIHQSCKFVNGPLDKSPSFDPNKK